MEIAGRVLSACIAILTAALLCGTSLSFADPSLRVYYSWISDRQDPSTGLVPSYDGDPALDEAAFTYDQALAAHVFIAFGDLERARRIIAFFERAERSENLYYTAYNSRTGAVWEYNIHVGPNAWIGLAALGVARRSGSWPEKALAGVIGDTLARMQDAEGGLKGGPSVDWYSTEHQISAYALFEALRIATGNGIYAKSRDATLAWLVRYAFDPAGPSVRRGKRDDTLACDTYSWSVASLGPSVLQQAGMDPQSVMQKAEDLCLVTVEREGTEGVPVVLSGFDFTDAMKIGRKPIISSEWTSQAALSWLIAGDAARASDYLERIAPLASGRSFPYASAPSADTGHGWKTPAGMQTGSVAGTAYYLLARLGYNPLDPNARLPNAENVRK